jgi:glycosyltransferase involved in cell wall biosynthesis
MSARHNKTIAAIADADIVLIHWWNHPLLYDFLVRETLPPSRIIFWSHIAGFHAPYVFTKPALYYPDLFVFTSPISLEVPEVRNLPESRKKDLRTIWSTGGIEHIASIKMLPHQGFNVGYIGTVDYSKMHPRFLQMSSMVNIPNVKFIVCGGPSEKQIEAESLRYGMGDRFLFTGHVDNINKYLSEFDVFGYPLASDHYGTCEQSLGESMAAGVPPVVWENKTETHIVEDGVTGLVVANEEQYVSAIEELHRNRDLWSRLSQNAREAARHIYSMDLMIKRWENVFNEALTIPKTPREWTGPYKGKTVLPHHVYLESLGGHGNVFLHSLSKHYNVEHENNIRKLYDSSPLWRAKTRGTPQHYHFFFPEDRCLERWSALTDIE